MNKDYCVICKKPIPSHLVDWCPSCQNGEFIPLRVLLRQLLDRLGFYTFCAIIAVPFILLYCLSGG